MIAVPLSAILYSVRGVIGLLVLCGLCGCPRDKHDDEDDGGSGHDVVLPTGVFEVTRTTRNEQDCRDDGQPVEDAVRFFRVEDAIRQGYRATTCAGENEPDCPTRDSYLGEAQAGGWENLDFQASSDELEGGETACALAASLTRLEPGEGGEVRYLQARWQSGGAEGPDACVRELAIERFQSDQLECVERIVRTGTALE